jgi:hypothetical protein
VWGESPPPGAVSALRAYASRLRDALSPDTQLRFQAPGYVLSLDGAELDATAFERLAATTVLDWEYLILTADVPDDRPVARRASRGRRARPSIVDGRPFTAKCGSRSNPTGRGTSTWAQHHYRSPRGAFEDALR